MNSDMIKATLILTLMTAIITMAFTTKNFVESQLLASFGVIIGAYASGQMLTQNEIKIETNESQKKFNS